MPVKIIWLLALLLCGFSLAMALAASPEPLAQTSHVVIGTLKELDLPKMNGKITTDLGQTVSFTIKSPDLFKGLSVGERIAVRLDDHGQVVKVMETTIPELLAPEQ
ncbi:MAG: hypothetical protein HXY51_17990 [Nitrospirae bacterium]|nr:hypothetical protein [Nitrospirota bacterium]